MFQSINTHYGDTWTMGRVGWTAVAGGTSSKIYGGQFRDGFMYAGVAALMSYGYSEISKDYNPTGKPHLWQEGQNDVGKQLNADQLKDLANGTMKTAPLSSDQSAFMKTVGKGPFMNAFGEFHDGLHSYPFMPGDQLSLILTMPPSYALTSVAAM